jgi:signal transduction histidine kinase
MEAIIARRTEELQKSNFTKDRLFSIISHDLRVPITSFHNITRLVNYYNKLGEKEKIDRLSLRIDQSVNNLNHLLDNLLHWAMAQTNEISCRVEKINIVRLLQEVIGMYQESMLAKELELTTDFPAQLDIAGDYHTLSTIFRNIISNAIKYTSRNGKIHITIKLEDDQALIKLSDTGIGIASEKLHRIFSVDEHKSTHGTENEKGTGLGLLVTKEFVHLNKGVIHINSAINKGTEVSVYLPRYSH